MDQGHKSENPLPLCEASPKALWAVQSHETAIAGSIRDQDSTSMEGPQRVPCEPDHTIQGNSNAQTKL